MSGPSPRDHQLSALLRKLAQAPADRRGLYPALQDVAALLDASGAHLLPEVPGAGVPPGLIHCFDLDSEEHWLVEALAAARADQGVCAVVRHRVSHADLLLVTRTHTPFGAEECGWLELLAPHFRQALDAAEAAVSPLPTLQAAASVARLLPLPCLLTDEAGRSLERNPAFDKVLQALHGSMRTGRIAFADSFLAGSWRQALAEARVTAQTQSLLANTGEGSWKVHVAPMACLDSPAGASPRVLMLVLFEKLAGARPPAHSVPSSPALTKAEFEVLGSLLLGHTAKVIARARGASVHTVRSQITSILGKTGHHTQKELIASIGGSTFESVIPEHGDVD
ncbi:MAG TPA: helix-turn-helix transcriptional regulator [Ramlibacter sp.]